MPVNLTQIDSVHITTLIDNVIDLTMPSQGPAKRPNYFGLPRVSSFVMDDGFATDYLQAEHGFSALVQVPDRDANHCLLFDAGLTPNGMMENMRRLGLSTDEIEAIVLSHGHLDHVIGLDALSRGLGNRNVPVRVHPDFWVRRRFVREGQEPMERPRPAKEAIQNAGFEIFEERNASLLLDKSVLVTGEVARTTEFEKGVPGYEEFVDGKWGYEPWIRHEQALVMNVREKGLVVLVGCGHAGIVNIVRYAIELTGVKRIYTIIGGFHLGESSMESRIPATVAALKEFNPQYIVPTHCTGWRAIQALETALPDAFIPNSVGTRFEL